MLQKGSAFQLLGYLGLIQNHLKPKGLPFRFFCVIVRSYLFSTKSNYLRKKLKYKIESFFDVSSLMRITLGIFGTVNWIQVLSIVSPFKAQFSALCDFFPMEEVLKKRVDVFFGTDKLVKFKNSVVCIIRKLVFF